MSAVGLAALNRQLPPGTRLDLYVFGPATVRRVYSLRAPAERKGLRYPTEELAGDIITDEGEIMHLSALYVLQLSKQGRTHGPLTI